MTLRNFLCVSQKTRTRYLNTLIFLTHKKSMVFYIQKVFAEMSKNLTRYRYENNFLLET